MDNPAPPHADLDECEQEPLAFSGHIQDVGALVATPRGQSTVAFASANLHRWFDRHDDGSPLELNGLFCDDCNYFTYRKKPVSTTGPSLVANVLTNRGVEGDLLISERGDHVLYEFEPKSPSTPMQDPVCTPTVTHSRDIPLEAVDIDALLRRIHALSRYPKIMLYRFFPDGSGEVIAELSENRLDNYQGLRFPASDIPRIARSLYIENPFRLIFDTQGPTSPILALAGDRPGPPTTALDLSHSTLRSVAEVHLEYLYNMQVRSSASFPVVVMGRLWGLMALHAVEPTTIHVAQRIELRKLIDHDLSRQLMDTQVREDHRRFNASVELLRESAGFLRDLREATPSDTGLAEIPRSLRALINCDGLALRLAGRVVFRDALVSAEELGKICAIGDAQALRGQFSTSSLSPFLDQDEDFRRRASGVLYSTTGSVGSRARLEIIWLRGEEAQHVNWAGKPEKLRREVEGSVRISPRQSFAVWQARTQGEARAWKSSDLLIASKLLIQLISRGLPGT